MLPISIMEKMETQADIIGKWNSLIEWKPLSVTAWRLFSWVVLTNRENREKRERGFQARSFCVNGGDNEPRNARNTRKGL